MAKSDGEKIQIVFDVELINQTISSASNAFNIDFQVPIYVTAGGLQSVNRIPNMCEYVPFGVDTDFSLGSMSSVQLVSGVLTLEEL